MFRRVLVSTLVVGVVLGATACSSSTESEAPAPTKQIGKSVNVRDNSGAGVVTLVSLATTSKAKYSGEKPESGEYVIIDVEYAGTEGSFAVNPLYVELKTSDGKKVSEGDGNATAAPADPRLKTGDLKPNEKRTGKIAFDVKLQPGTKAVVLNVGNKVAGEIDLT